MPKTRSQLPLDPPPRYSGQTDDPDIKELHESFDYAMDAWRDIRYEGDIDMRYLAGDPWEPAARNAREDAGRPVLSLDELGQYVNQIINDVRQNKRAIQVTPLGNGANDATAALRADLVRQIEYRSNAQQAYTTMFENAVQRSYGYLRVKAQHESPTSRHQELIIEPLMNPDLVTPDPDAVKPALEDMKYLFNQESWSKTEFRKRFPKAEIQDFSTEQARQAPRWVQDERVMLAEWWRIVTKPATVVYVDVPVPATASERETTRQVDVLERDLAAKGLAAFGLGARVVGQRQADMPSVSMRLTNGLEILQETTWPGRMIPFVGCFGKILYVDQGTGSKKRILSAVRLARDPQMLYCYYRTAEAELVGMATRFPYFVRAGSLSPEEAQKLTQSTHEPVAFITIKAMSDGVPPGQMPEFPQRNMFEPSIAALEAGAEGARRAIQAAMGISPLPTSAQRRNEKSGVALQQIEESAQRGTFHFVDHYDAAIARVGVILDDLVPHFYDAVRDLTVRGANDRSDVVRVNDPTSAAPAESAYATEGQAPSLTTGDHDVTIATGPSYASSREAANDFSSTLVQQMPQIAAVSGPQAAAKILALAVKLKDIGPYGDEMADIISPAEEPGALPPQAQQALQQMQQQLQAAAEEIQTLKSGVMVAQVKAESDQKITGIESARDLELQRMKDATAIAVAEIGAATKGVMSGLTAQHEAVALAQEQAHERAMRAADATHEQMMTEQAQQHQAGLTEQQGQQSSDLAAQQAQYQQDAAAQQAALAPAPEEESTA